MTYRIDRRGFCALLASAGVMTTGVARTGVAHAQPGIFSEFGAAIRGADPVAFFRQSAAVEGSRQHSYRWRGATWLFSSAENRALFAANPEAYAPQYDGWCAWAMTRGILAETDPTAWTIRDDKLYLNFNSRTLERFKRDLDGNIDKANTNWLDEHG